MAGDDDDDDEETADRLDKLQEIRNSAHCSLSIAASPLQALGIDGKPLLMK